MRIQHNIMAMNSYRNLSGNNGALSKNLEKLSSGYRINRAGDDAAGLAISEKMRAQIAGLDQAQKNAQSGINLVKTAEGALTEVHDMLNRMVTLASQSANGTYTNTDREKLQAEIDALTEEIDRIADNSNFNGTKLLDGSLEVGKLTEDEVKFDTLASTAGVSINEAKAGGGTKGSVTIDLTNAFTEGDTVTINMLNDRGVAQAAKTFTMKNSPSGTAAEFGGKTAEEQAKNLAAKLGVDGDIGTNFDITVDGTKITLTSRVEGTAAPLKIDSIAVADSDVVLAANTKPSVTPGAAYATAATVASQSFALIGGATTGAAAVVAGDKLTFEFKDANGVKLEVELEVTDAMYDPNAEKMTNNILDALKNATFKDNEDTQGVDESQIKVSEIFTLAQHSTNKGTITVAGPSGVSANGNGSAVKVTHNHAGTDIEILAQGDASAANGTPGGTASTVTFAAANMANNFSVGDKVTLEGTLRDGSTFKVDLIAGQDFEIDTDAAAATAKQNTLDNIVTALKSDKVTVQITNRDQSTTTITADKLFGAAASDKKEFTVTGGTDLTIKSTYAGTAATFSASEITKLEITPLKDASATLTKDLAVAQSAAESSFVIDEKVKYGAAIKVGDKTYEIVADARDTTNRNNTAIVVSDLTDSKAIAKQLADAIQKDQADYNVTSSDGKVTIASKRVGSDQVALEVTAPYGDEVTTASFKFDTAQVEEGSTLEFNGNTYEFVKEGNKASKGAIAIEVADFAKATAKDLATAFADVAKNGLVTVGNDGTVTVKSFEADDGTIAKPELSFGKDLTLQIGADAVETIGVSVASMKAKDLGIANLNIGDVDNANKAIDTIKNAIESVSVVRGNLGAIQNRLEHTINNLGVMEENIQDAEANIRDTDIADEMMAYTKNNILIQSAQAMLAQANQVPQGVLQLMG